MGNTPDINHRYCGWRESVKLSSQVYGSIADITKKLTELLILQHKLKTVYNLKANISSVDSLHNSVQSARGAMDFIRTHYKG